MNAPTESSELLFLPVPLATGDDVTDLDTGKPMKVRGVSVVISLDGRTTLTTQLERRDGNWWMPAPTTNPPPASWDTTTAVE